MTNALPRPVSSYVVTRPRASDAVGCALRDAFSREPLPDDMLALLGQLNGNGGMRSRN